MAVRTMTATDLDRTGGPPPIRTCIGCRQRAAAAELLRVARGQGPLQDAVIPDPTRRAPGRGAWLHPVAACVALAERRRAFGRALRVTGPIDPAPVRHYVARHGEQHGPISPSGPPAGEKNQWPRDESPAMSKPTG